MPSTPVGGRAPIQPQGTANVSKPLQINDLFWTIQGEGRWAGHRALFVRMPYCNYDCPWCDTEYDSYKNYSLEEFEIFCTQEPARFAVITGGEPTAHKDTPRVIELLKKHGFYIACETNGSLPIPVGIDFPTVSPKRFTKSKFAPYHIHESVYASAKEWKYVVDKDFDFSILNRHKSAAKFMADTAVVHSLSPEHGDMAVNTQSILNYVAENPQWKLSLQTHKWINVP